MIYIVLGKLHLYPAGLRGLVVQSYPADHAAGIEVEHGGEVERARTGGTLSRAYILFTQAFSASRSLMRLSSLALMSPYLAFHA